MTVLIVLFFLAAGIGLVVTTVVVLVRKLSPPRIDPHDPRWVAGAAGATGFFDGTPGQTWTNSGSGCSAGWPGDVGSGGSGCGGGSSSGCSGGSSSGGSSSSCGGGSSSSCGGGSSSSCGGGS